MTTEKTNVLYCPEWQSHPPLERHRAVILTSYHCEKPSKVNVVSQQTYTLLHAWWGFRAQLSREATENSKECT